MGDLLESYPLPITFKGRSIVPTGFILNIFRPMAQDLAGCYLSQFFIALQCAAALLLAHSLQYCSNQRGLIMPSLSTMERRFAGPFVMCLTAHFEFSTF